MEQKRDPPVAPPWQGGTDWPKTPKIDANWEELKSSPLKPGYTLPGAVFILLAGATAHAAGTIDQSVADDG